MKQKKKPSLRSRILRLLAALVLVWAVLFSGLWIWGLAEGRGGEADVMIVLGSNVLPNGEPNTVLEARLREALARYQAAPLPIVCCGAQGPDEPMPEGEAMKAWLVKNGVPQDAVTAETASFNTYENIGNALSLLPQGAKKALIVTSDYHVPRAIRIARAKGLEAAGLASSIWLPLNRLRGNTREILAWIKFLWMSLTGKV